MTKGPWKCSKVVVGVGMTTAASSISAALATGFKEVEG